MSGDSIRVMRPLFPEAEGGSIPTSPLQLQIGPIGMRQAQALNRLWHSVLPETHLGNLVGAKRSVAFVAEHSSVAYAVAIWTDPIAANRMKDSAHVIELRRFAIGPDAPRNTASRMLSVMSRLLSKRWPELTRLISYQAVESHQGTIYKAAGWRPVATSRQQRWHPREHRADAQIVSDKIRWEKALTPPNRQA